MVHIPKVGVGGFKRERTDKRRKWTKERTKEIVLRMKKKKRGQKKHSCSKLNKEGTQIS